MCRNRGMRDEEAALPVFGAGEALLAAAGWGMMMGKNTCATGRAENH